jgi:tetratricopeptide (TPR) repeat protein
MPRIWPMVLAALVAATVATVALPAERLSRDEALQALARVDASDRLAGVRRLAEVGTMGDVAPLIDRLRDGDELVRLHAADAMWRIWGRSGDAEIDELYLRGSGELKDGDLRDALATFDQIILRKPDFAEGWNKRATIRFLLGDYENSLLDCDEVFKRNPYHFGALAGAGQIHILLGHPEQALDFFRRALAVNPNLEGPAQMKEMIERHLREEERDRRRHAT